MAGVGGVMKLVRQVIGNWKVGKNCELKLNCESGVMKVTMTADLGSWIQPTSKSSESGNSVHQGPRRRAGPSYLRRQEKRAAARVAAVAATAVEQTAQEKAEDAETASPAAPPTPAPAAPPGSQQVSRTCKKCGQPCCGHAGPSGARCSNAPSNTSTPEKLRGSSIPLPEQVTPARRPPARQPPAPTAVDPAPATSPLINLSCAPSIHRPPPPLTYSPRQLQPPLPFPTASPTLPTSTSAPRPPAPLTAAEVFQRMSEGQS